MDASDFSLPSASGSRLLSDSPLVLPSHSLSFSNTGPGGDDLSLSELSIADPTSSIFSKPFTLLAEPSPPEKPADTPGNGSTNAAPEQAAEVDGRSRRQVDEKQREEKLRSDLFILKKLNSAFSLFHEALDESGSANERVAAQLRQTDALLNKYIDILSRSEEFSRLILDEQWMEELERERNEAREKARREEEERVLAEQREKERREREERERIEKEEKERMAREQQERLAARGTARGVRGLRASVRGTRGTTRPASSSAVGTGTKRYTSARTTNTTISARGTTRRT
ncbi:hypothetical protein F5887DRAFT_1061506 [Amanita rubescens]|nr:hypothetical protein F5887DRAFT_1061506 [Amanita rubescens]